MDDIYDGLVQLLFDRFHELRPDLTYAQRHNILEVHRGRYDRATACFVVRAAKTAIEICAGQGWRGTGPTDAFNLYRVYGIDPAELGKDMPSFPLNDPNCIDKVVAYVSRRLN